MLLKTTKRGLRSVNEALRVAYPGARPAQVHEAIARGLGFNTHRGFCDLANKTGVVCRPISEPAFAAAFHELTGFAALPDALTAAAIRSAPELLWGQNLQEGFTVAMACAIKETREDMEAADRGPWRSSRVDVLRGKSNEWTGYIPRAFDVWVEEQDGNDFQVGVNFGIDGPTSPPLIWPNTDDALIAGLIDGDLGAIRRILREDVWQDVSRPETEELRRIQVPPVFELGAFSRGQAVQVWRDAIAVTHLTEAGNFEVRSIFLISEPTFSRIEREMRRLGLSYVATAEAIRLIEDIVDSSPDSQADCVLDWESGALAAAYDRAPGEGPAAASPAD